MDWWRELWFIKPAPPIPDQWPDEDDLLARLMISEGRLERSLAEVQRLRALLATREDRSES